MIALQIGQHAPWKEFGMPWERRLPHTDLVTNLQLCLDEICSKPYPRCGLKLKLFRELITQPALVLLIQLLNQPFTSQSSSTIESTTITGDQTAKWQNVDFIECQLVLPDSAALQTLEDKDLYCSPDDIKIFVSTVALRTKELSLSVQECPDMLHALYDASQLEISSWAIEKTEFSALDCARFANSLQRSVPPPTQLVLRSNVIEQPLVLAEGLINIKTLFLSGCLWRRANSPSAGRSYPSLGETLLGEDGNSIMQMLLQSPLSQLKDLWLRDVQLDDRHFMAMVDMLPASQLEELSLTLDNISWHGIMALAQQLPQITSLKTILIPSKSKEDRLKGHQQECCMALTQGMRENYSIETLYMEELDPTGEAYLFSYYADLNHAGRRILVSSKPVPAGLWPWILERAGTKCFRHCKVVRWESPEIRRKKQEIRRVDSIYFLLRNCQALLDVH